MMKRFAALFAALLLAASAAGCATASKSEEDTRVKCPACGYEFEAPMGG